jgi:hypothetical protein
MREDLMDMVVLVDRSGSMSSIKRQMESALKELFKGQKKEKGKCVVSLYSFDDPGTYYSEKRDGMQLEEHYKAKPIKDVKDFVLSPRGMTPLLDALGHTLSKTKKRITKKRKKDRPGRVLFVIVTDGLENASSEFSKADIRKLIDQRESKDKWQFIYLGANQDAMAVGRDLGIKVDTSVTFAATDKGVKGTGDVLNRKISAARCCAIETYQSGQALNYSQEERDECMGFEMKE